MITDDWRLNAMDTPQPRRRGPGRPFEKGNKAAVGHSVQSASVRAMARSYARESIDRLAELINSEDGHVAVAACKVILDRGYGKPMQSVKKTVTHVKRSPRDYSLEELEKMFADTKPEAMQ